MQSFQRMNLKRDFSEVRLTLRIFKVFQKLQLKWWKIFYRRLEADIGRNAFVISYVGWKVSKMYYT